MTDDVDIDVVQITDSACGEDGVDRTSREDPAILDHHQRAADPGRECEVMGGNDDRRASTGVQIVEQRSDAKLILEVQRGGGLVQNQDFAPR